MSITSDLFGSSSSESELEVELPLPLELLLLVIIKKSNHKTQVYMSRKFFANLSESEVPEFESDPDSSSE